MFRLAADWCKENGEHEDFPPVWITHGVIYKDDGELKLTLYYEVNESSEPEVR